MELVANWYMREPDPKRRSTGGIPVLYQKYVGHDNNRDFYMVNQPETEATSRILYHEWFPQIMYNHHQTGPAGTVLFAPPFRDPFNYNFDPLIPMGSTWWRASMHNRFVAEGKPGATMRSGANYSTWWNGGLRTTVYFHNMIGLLTEIIGNPTPMQIPFVPQRQLPTATTRCRSRRRSGTSGSRSTTRSPPTARCSTSPRAIASSSSTTSTTMGRNAIRKGSQDTWTVTPKDVAAIEESMAAERGAAAGPAGRGAGGRGGAAGAAQAGGGRGGGAALKYFKMLRGPAGARSARLHHPVRSAGLPDRDEVRQYADQDRHDGPPGDGGVRGGGQEVPGRIVRREDRAGLPAARPGHVRAAGPPERLRVSGRAAAAALRQRRLDAGVPDGRRRSTGSSTGSTARSRSSTGSPRCRRAASWTSRGRRRSGS